MKYLIIMLGLLAIGSYPARAQDKCFDLLPLMNQGRVQPLESFAVQSLKSYAGKERLQDISATTWLSERLFDAGKAYNRPVFKIADPELRELLKLKGDKTLVSFGKLDKALHAQAGIIKSLGAAEKLTPPQQALLELTARAASYKSLPESLFAGLPTGKDYAGTWKEIGAAWRKKDNAAFRALSCQALAQATAEGKGTRPRLAFENFYAHSKIFLWAAVFFTLACAASFATIRISILFYSTAVGLNAAGILMRIYILQRPPVGSLYESILFVALILAACALLIGRAMRPGMAARIGGAGAAALLLLSPYFIGEGGDMAPLSAVLNTNFWLATHVICITAGYGLCITTALLAHAMLAAAALRRPLSAWPLPPHLLHVMSLGALLFTAFGTILGGIWADQSWGRFWGWDPKENGALLIVLWIVWLQHGRLGQCLSPPFFTAGLAFLNVVVALAWFGVNLLGTGLHSYGFTQGAAVGLALFCMAETILIGSLLYGLGRKSHAP